MRRAAFHTLFDGGNLDDPALDEIFRRMLTTETHQKLRMQLEEQVNKREKAAAERTEISQMAIMAVGDNPKQGRSGMTTIRTSRMGTGRAPPLFVSPASADRK